MLNIYTHKITPRNRYIFNLVFTDMLGIAFSLYDDSNKFKELEGAKLSYTFKPLDDELFIASNDLLFEKSIKDQTITIKEFRNNKMFFSTNKRSHFPFDIFAASFYLVSRFEEYLPHVRDKHNRFPAQQSIAYLNEFLQKPLVNIYVNWIKEALLEKYPSLIFKTSKYEFISTIDIDNAYAYREKGVLRTLGGYARAFFKFDIHGMWERTKVLLKLEVDPFDTYDFQLEMRQKYQFKSIYFFLLGNYGLNDKNISIQNPKFQTLIKHLGDYAKTGIHPSYGSNDKPEQIKKEVERLSKVLHRDITDSRQHFLKLTIPETYRNLIAEDITDDYTMGYATDIGFRASICSPFYFYDLDMEMETKLKIHPFAMMEGALKYGLKVKPKDAMTYIRPLIDEIKAVDGTFMSLWHNESMSNKKLWKGWKPVYEEMIQYALEKR